MEGFYWSSDTGGSIFSSLTDSSRMSSGYWTWRVRKKRCDGYPSRCNACSRLGLKCDDDGSKPEWKDGGIKENKYRQQLKVLVRRGSTHSRTQNPRLLEDSSDRLEIDISC